MSGYQDTIRERHTPRHIWVIGILALLWSAFGAMDYVLTQIRFEPYMKEFTPEQLAFFYGFPAWVVGAWAVAVWGGVVGSVLLLMRKRLAVVILLVSWVAMIITSIHNFILSNGVEAMGGAFPLIFSAVIFCVSLGLFIYARAMAVRGVLD
ncbi:MAG: hypothetical protein ABIZ91_17030 [Gemmatimonadaceae bacterium]